MAAGRLTLFEQSLRAESRRLSTPRRREIATEIVTDARSTAPRLTGAYVGGMAVEVEGSTVRAVDTDITSIHKEYGTSRTPAHAALTNAAMRFGRYSGTRPR